MGTRVIHAGTGTTGSYALKAILDDPTLDLVGWWVSSPGKEGLDAGSFCGRASVGVRGTRDVATLLTIDADCLMYAASAVGRDGEATADMARFLAAGVNVVTFVLESMSFPPAGPPAIVGPLEAACREGGATFFASGSEPGFFTMPLPAVLLSGLGRIDRYREQQFALDMVGVYPVEKALRGSMGFGLPSGTMPPRIGGGIVERWWGPNIHAIAAMLGVTVERLELTWETADTPVDIETRIGGFDAGTVAAYRWELAGYVNARPAISVEYIAALVPDVSVPDHWPKLGADRGGSAIVYQIDGAPSMRTEVTMGSVDGVTGSLPLTALHCVNAIPHVVAAPPGVVHALQLPYYATRIPAFAAKR